MKIFIFLYIDFSYFTFFRKPQKNSLEKEMNQNHQSSVILISFSWRFHWSKICKLTMRIVLLTTSVTELKYIYWIIRSEIKIKYAVSHPWVKLKFVLIPFKSKCPSTTNRHRIAQISVIPDLCHLIWSQFWVSWYGLT